MKKELNYFLRNPKISLKAKGLYSLMLDMKNSKQNYSVELFAETSSDGRDSVTSAIKELESNGMLRRERITDKNGCFAGYKYILLLDDQH